MTAGPQTAPGEVTELRVQIHDHLQRYPWLTAYEVARALGRRSVWGVKTTPDDQIGDWVQMFPVVKITERYVWVNGCHRWDRDRLMRFSREDLETKGRAWNGRQRLGLYTRPLPHWPVLLVSNERANVLPAGDPR